MIIVPRRVAKQRAAEGEGSVSSFAVYTRAQDKPLTKYRQRLVHEHIVGVSVLVDEDELWTREDQPSAYKLGPQGRIVPTLYTK